MVFELSTNWMRLQWNCLRNDLSWIRKSSAGEQPDRVSGPWHHVETTSCATPSFWSTNDTCISQGDYKSDADLPKISVTEPVTEMFHIAMGSHASVFGCVETLNKLGKFPVNSPSHYFYIVDQKITLGT